MKKNIHTFIISDWTSSEKCLLAADMLLLGVLIGWLTSPFKRIVPLFGTGSVDIDIEPEDEAEKE